MSMQISCLSQPPVILPPSDIDKMKSELENINKLMQIISAGFATEATYEGLKVAVEAINEIIFSLDNSNDFHKIGGFEFLMPLLSCSNSEVVAVTSELVADLCQNNSYCQSKILDFNILPELVKQLENPDAKIRSKSLYAISCLCRHNEDAVNQLAITGIIPSLMNFIQESNERLRAKAAFFLSYLSTFENLRESLYQEDVIKILAKLVKEVQDSSSEHLLSALLEQVSKHKQSRIQCRQPEHNLKYTLIEKIQLYDSKSEYQESKQYCEKILDSCFHDEMKVK